MASSTSSAPFVGWSIVSSAIFVPTSASWMLVSDSPHHLFLSETPPANGFHVRLALPLSPALHFPLPCMSFSRLPPAGSTTLFVGFFHSPSHQTHKLALRFVSASHLGHCLAFLQTAVTLGAQSRLTPHLPPLPFSSFAHRYRHDADSDVNAVRSQALEVEPDPVIPSSSACTGPGSTIQALAAAQLGTAADCPGFWEVQDAPVSESRSLPSTEIRGNVVTFEPEVDAAEGRNLDVDLRNEPLLKKRCTYTPITSPSRFFPGTASRCLSIPAASSSSLGSASRCLEIHNNENVLYRQMCDKDHVAASEVENPDQSSSRGIEDGLDNAIADGLGNANGIDPSPFIPVFKEALNWPQEQSLQQSRCGPGTRTVDMFHSHASKDSDSGDLRSELLGCLLDPSFRLLVERVEDLLGQIENPASIDLVALADFLALRP